MRTLTLGILLGIAILGADPALAGEAGWVLAEKRTPQGTRSTYRSVGTTYQTVLQGTRAIQTKSRGGRIDEQNRFDWRELPKALKPGSTLRVRVTPRVLVARQDRLSGRPLNVAFFMAGAAGPGVHVKAELRKSVAVRSPRGKRHIDLPVPRAGKPGERYVVTLHPVGLKRGTPTVVYVYTWDPGEEPLDFRVEFIDANPIYFDGRMPDELTGADIARSREVRQGTVTDGVSRLIVRVRKTRDVPIAIDIEKGGGTISRLKRARRFEGRDGTVYGFLLYTPRETFGGGTRKDRPRAIFDPSAQPRKRLDDVLEYEDLVLRAQPMERDKEGKWQPKGKQRLAKGKLARPPVVLVHGLFSNPVETWIQTHDAGQSFAAMLERAGLMPFLCNYQLSNGAGDEARESTFASNARVIWESPDPFAPEERGFDWFQNPGSTRSWLSAPPLPILSDFQRVKATRFGGIRHALQHYREKLQLAATQADVVGHSMGGVLARVYAAQPDYKRPTNFHAGDIHRLITICAPHFGSEIPELRSVIDRGRVRGESFAAWMRRELSSWILWYYMGPEESGAMRDLQAGSAALAGIGPTPLPSFAIATRLESHQLGDPRRDAGNTYLYRFGALAMMFFNNRPLLEAFVRERAEVWRKAGRLQRKTDRHGEAPGPEKGEVVDWASEEAVELFLRSVNAAIDESVYYWDVRHAPDRYDEMKTLIGSTPVLPLDWVDGGLGRDHGMAEEERSVRQQIVQGMANALVGGDLETLALAKKPQAMPLAVVGVVRDLVFHNDGNDGCVRVESQLGGLDASATALFKSDANEDRGISHGTATWYYPVIRQTIDLLKWEDARFWRKGFPAAGRAMPYYMPSMTWSHGRVRGREAIRWAGYVEKHAELYGKVADREDRIIIGRPVNRDSTRLLADGAAAKGMAVKGKSSNWGPQRGFICLDQRYSKLWRTKAAVPDERAKQIEKYSKLAESNLTDKYPRGGDPQLEGRVIAVKRPLELPLTAPQYAVVVDPAEGDAEKAVYLRHKESGELYDWRNTKETHAGRTEDNFDIEKPIQKLSPQPSAEVVARLQPMEVLSCGLSDLEPKPYLTADYDLLAIAFRDGDGTSDEPARDADVPFHPTFGNCSKRQIALIEMLNRAVIEEAGHPAGRVTHHGPENQYKGSPYIDYPLLVFDPGEKARDGKAEIFLIRQGPIGYRDIHLKRYFTQRIRDRYHLYPNAVSAGWRWWGHRPFDPKRGYDPRDAWDLARGSVAEQPRPPPGSDADAGTATPSFTERLGDLTAAMARVRQAIAAGSNVLGVLADVAEATTWPGLLDALARHGLLGETLEALSNDNAVRAFVSMLQPDDLVQTLARWVEAGHHKEAMKSLARGGWIGPLFKGLSDANLMDAAIQVLVDGEYPVGVIYEQLEKRGWPKAIENLTNALRKLADQGNPSALVDIAIQMAGRGKGSAAAMARSVEIFRRAAQKHGNARAMVHLARHHLNGWGAPKDMSEALKWFKKAADLGEAAGFNGLGFMHERGFAVEKSLAEARRLYEQAWKQDLPMAKHNLARLLATMGGTERVEAQAFDLTLEAAEDDFGPSQSRVALLYETGQGVPKDEVQARHWYARAAEKEQPWAMVRLARMHEEGRGGTKDVREALVLYARAAATGDAWGLLAYGNQYKRGAGVPRDYARARDLYEQAAAKGSVEAYFQLGVLYLNGWGVPTDYLIASRYCERAAEHGHAAAMSNLGVVFHRGGHGLERDDVAAFRWFHAAARAGNAYGAHNTALLLTSGKGTARDLVEAYAWHSVAIDRGVKEAVAARDALARRLTSRDLRRARARTEELASPVADGSGESPAPPPSPAGKPSDVHSDPELGPVLRRLRGPDADAAFQAALELDKRGDLRAVPALIEALGRNKDIYVRLAAATALGRMRAVDAVLPLSSALADEEALVRTASSEALTAITGRSFAPSGPPTRAQAPAMRRAVKAWYAAHAEALRKRLGQVPARSRR